MIRSLPEYPSCTLKELPADLLIAASNTAIARNPANRPAERAMALLATLRGQTEAAPEIDPPAELAMLTSKYWGSKGIDLTVGFMDNSPLDLQKRILSHMNAWSKTANVKFRLSKRSPQVRIARASTGYWSYLGTDILHIPPSQQTMNLQGFTMQTPESEFTRVVRHETGHTLGCPHEHTRAAIINQLDPQKTVQYFYRTSGWSPQQTKQQVLTPLNPADFVGTSQAEEMSIMCYQFPGMVTKDGQPIPGGNDISKNDAILMGMLYPL